MNLAGTIADRGAEIPAARVRAAGQGRPGERASDPLLPCRQGYPAQRSDARPPQREELCGPGYGESRRKPANLCDVGRP